MCRLRAQPQWPDGNAFRDDGIAVECAQCGASSRCRPSRHPAAARRAPRGRRPAGPVEAGAGRHRRHRAAGAGCRGYGRSSRAVSAASTRASPPCHAQPEAHQENPTEDRGRAPAPTTGAAVLQQARHTQAVEEVDKQVGHGEKHAGRAVHVARPEQRWHRQQGVAGDEQTEDPACSVRFHVRRPQARAEVSPARTRRFTWALPAAPVDPVNPTPQAPLKSLAELFPRRWSKACSR